MLSPQLETKGQNNKQIAVSPQLETNGQQNKRIVQQNGKQSRHLRAKVIQRKQQNVKRSPQLESVQSETKSHQIKEMREHGDMQYRQSGNVQNGHQTDNNKNQPQLVDSSCQDNPVSTSQVMQSEDVLKEHQTDNSQYQLQLVDTSHLDNSGDNSAATSQDLQSPQSGNVQNQHCLSKSYPQTDNYKYQPQLVDMSCKDNSAATFQYLQFPQSGHIQNGHQPDNNKNQPQLVDSSRQGNPLASYLLSPQSGNVQNGHQTDNKNQPQLVDSSCLDDSVATSEAMQYPQSEKVQNQHQPDNNKYQPKLVGTSCLDSSVATSEANYPQSDNIQNQHCSGQPYPHLDIRTSQPQQVDTSHQESSTSREDLDSTSNRQDAKQTTQGLMESNQDRTNKLDLQLDIRNYQQQQVDTSRQESSDDQTSREELGSTINQQDPQWLFVPNQQQPSKPYPHLAIRTYQPQQVDTSHQESSDDQTSRKEINRTINREDPQWMDVPNQQQHSKPYPQLDIRTYQPQQVNSSESSDDPTSGKGVVSSVSKDVMQYLQLETVLCQQQLDTPYLQLDVETYQPQRVDTSRQESFNDLTSGKELVSAYNKDVIQPPQLDRLQPSKPYPQLDIRTYQLQQVDNSYQESSDEATSGKDLDHTLNKVKLCEVYHTLVQLKYKHVEEAAESVVLWKCFFIKCDPQLGILSKMKSHITGGNLMTIGLKIDLVNLQRVDISERRVTSTDPVAMVTCKLDYVEESNLGSKFVIRGSAYSSTVKDTLQVGSTTYNCDTEPVLRTVVQYEIEIHTFEPSTSSPPGRDDQYAVVPRRMQDILKYAGYEFTHHCHPQCSTSIEGIVWGTCTLIKYCQKVVMVTSSEGSDPETSRIWDPGGTSRFVKTRD